MGKIAIVFDIGNVILDYKPMRFLRRRYPQANRARFVKSLYENIFASEEWKKLDEGVITYEEAIVVFNERMPGHSSEITEIMDIWWKYMTIIMPTFNIMRSLADNGVSMYYLSNFHEDPSIKVRGLFDFWDMFAGGVFSWEEKLVKPDREIYKRFLEKYSLRAENCVFIDDMQVNIDAANELGFTSILFKGGDSLRIKLEEVLDMPLIGRFA